MSDILLEMRDVEKSFPGVKALDKARLVVRRGTVHALMGENGAGKSTLMKCLFGIHEKDGGEVLLEGVPVSFKNPRDALEHGVAMVHQELNQAMSRSVMDNIWLGRYPLRLGIFTSEREMYKRTSEIFKNLGLTVDPAAQMSTLSVSTRQMVEIAKAVSYGARVIVLDEPTSSLTDEETERLFRIIAMLKERGCGIIYISHKMEEIRRISDDITVMRDGRHIETDTADNMPMEKIIRLMVGRELKERFPAKTGTVGEVILEVKGLTAEHSHVRDVSFNVRAGEVVGIAGLGGAGRTEVLETIFVIAERRSGEIFLGGRAVKNKNPMEAIKNGFALITEERRRDGIFGILDITENTVISSLEKYRTGGFFLSGGKMKGETDRMIDAMRIKTPSKSAKIRSLSGGNQQKVIMGRWLLTDPQVLLLDEPTRGIDVGAKYEIYSLILELASRGRAVIKVSSEMPELLGICDRILVMSGGRLAGEVKAADTTQEEIMELASRFA
ncbi:MAG: ATP-binding cassette domain-containing protein [Clostridia bacterium]|nr:ATP-binding cassette domain-containing protein [Clostridia bacterium]